jgi:predicted SprT family Zn-dependent metalloprotease
MDLVKNAYCGLYSENLTEYSCSLRYSTRLKAFNAHVRISKDHLGFALSSRWKDVSEDIQIGLLQDLLIKVLKKPAKSMYVDLYHNFIKKLHLVTPGKKADSVLEASFERVNAEYFFGLIDTPNLVFGRPSKRTLGSYNFHTNTITISPLLRDAPRRILDYVIYHELLHKKMQFSTGKLRNLYHSQEFRRKEKEFADAKEIEKEIKHFLRGNHNLYKWPIISHKVRKR